MLHEYQNRGLADGAVRKNNKTKDEKRGEARIAVRNRLKTKEDDFESGGFFAEKSSLLRLRRASEGAGAGAERQKH
jgi:hypothetical protein